MNRQKAAVTPKIGGGWERTQPHVEKRVPEITPKIGTVNVFPPGNLTPVVEKAPKEAVEKAPKEAVEKAPKELYPPTPRTRPNGWYAQSDSVMIYCKLCGNVSVPAFDSRMCSECYAKLNMSYH